MPNTDGGATPPADPPAGGDGAAAPAAYAGFPEIGALVIIIGSSVFSMVWGVLNVIFVSNHLPPLIHFYFIDQKCRYG